MKANDILHRMLNHQIVLIVDLLKQQLNEHNDTSIVIANKRKYLL